MKWKPKKTLDVCGSCCKSNVEVMVDSNGYDRCFFCWHEMPSREISLAVQSNLARAIVMAMSMPKARRMKL